MEVIRSLKEVPIALRGGVLAIGNFDGVHKGHQAVISTALEVARDMAAPCGVMTFEPHPRQFFQPDTPMFRLTEETQKLALLEAIGVDFAVVLRFDEAFAARLAEDFVKEILLEGLGASHIVTGFDFCFGHKRSGTPETMTLYGEQMGFGVSIVSAESDREEVYSSSRIRAALREGNVAEAARMLGHWWRVSAQVETGAGRGRKMGFPTVNLPVPAGFQLKHGIYAVRIVVGGEQYHGAAYFGTRPTFDGDGEPHVALEAFLFDFSGDLYGKNVAIEFIEYIRGDKVFDGADALAVQIALDCDAARKILRELEENGPIDDVKSVNEVFSG